MLDMKQGYETADCSSYGILKTNANYNRNHPTEAESLMWELLSGKNLGVRFRRQHIIDEYIVDFVCLRKKLVIEIDGGYHFAEEQTHLDNIRTERLMSLGFKVIRFTNEEVIAETENVLQKIKEIANE